MIGSSVYGARDPPGREVQDHQAGWWENDEESSEQSVFNPDEIVLNCFRHGRGTRTLTVAVGTTWLTVREQLAVYEGVPIAKIRVFRSGGPEVNNNDQVPQRATGWPLECRYCIQIPLHDCIRLTIPNVAPGVIPNQNAPFDKNDDMRPDPGQEGEAVMNPYDQHHQYQYRTKPSKLSIIHDSYQYIGPEVIR